MRIDEGMTAVVHRKGRKDWHFSFNPSFGELTHATNRGTVYAVLEGMDCGKPFWIGQLIPEVGWVSAEAAIRAWSISFYPIGGEYLFPCVPEGG